MQKWKKALRSKSRDLARIESLTKRLSDLELEQKEPVIIAKILGSLPSAFDSIRAAWYAVPKADQTYDKLTEHLISEEALMKLRAGSEKKRSAMAFLAVDKRGRGRGRYGTGGSSNLSQTYLRGNNNILENHQFSNGFGQRRRRCNYCNAPGHYGRECPDKFDNSGGRAVNDSSRNRQNFESSSNWSRRGGYSGNNSPRRGNSSYGRSFIAQGTTPNEEFAR